MKKYNRFPTISRITYAILLLISYLFASRFLYSVGVAEHVLFLNILFWVCILSLIGVIRSFYTNLTDDIKSGLDNRVLIKQRVVILFIWIISVLAAKQTGWFVKDVAPSVIVFVSFIPAVWLLKVRNPALTQLALICLLFTAIFTSGHMQAAATFAEITYLWIGASVIIYLTQTHTYVE